MMLLILAFWKGVKGIEITLCRGLYSVSQTQTRSFHLKAVLIVNHRLYDNELVEFT